MSNRAKIEEHPVAKVRAAADIAHRSFAGPIGCVFVVAILLASTPLYRDHPVATGLFVAAMLARLAPRLVLAVLWRRRPEPPRFPPWAIASSAYLLSLPTGLFGAFIIGLYGFLSWNAFLIVLFALSCAISGASVTAPHLKLVLAFQITLLLPIVVNCFRAGGDHATMAGLSMTLFLVYVIIHSIRLNADYWNSVAADLALKERAEQLQAARLAADVASQAKSEFLAKMSHEIRTPMNGVLGMLELVLDTGLSGEQREYLGYARQSAHSLLTLLNDLLDHSKAESGKLVLEQIDFSIHALVGEAVTPFLVQAAAKGLNLTCTVREGVPEYLRGDPTRVRQVAVNLVSNAIKFTPSGSITFSVAMDGLVDGRTVLHFQVADTGPGIPEEKQQGIFEAFSQGDNSITRRFGGSGLGLAICRDLVSLMGGRIWVESEPGRGSTFHFTARFAAPSMAAPAERPAVLSPGVPDARPLRILVAEDNLINQKLLTRLLAKAGHEFEVAANGEAACSLWDGNRFDLVLMDVQMPVMDGLEATRRIRAAEASNGCRIPIVGVTAGASSGELEACIDSGMDACITKPIMIADLDNLLAGVSRGHAG
ncbi:MAG TPA: ATP-binding protein [Bryobacteraceae bacterium]|nr:ATP-binding protein [Bryobacteraceae bacterium]